MKKLHLDPDTLSVESFAAQSAADERIGTVEAREDATRFSCNPNTTLCGVCFCTEQCV